MVQTGDIGAERALALWPQREQELAVPGQPRIAVRVRRIRRLRQVQPENALVKRDRAVEIGDRVVGR